MARRRGKKDNQNNNGRNNNRKSGVNQVKKQGYGSDLKPTRCSMCRYNNPKEPCYKKRPLLEGLEYQDCVPAMIHYSYKKLEAAGLI